MNSTVILLVEDETVTALVEKRLLESRGYSVRHVHTGEEAVTCVLASPSHYDLILMDIDLGAGIDGTEAARQILHEINIPVVFLSAHTEPEVVEKTEKVSSYGFVVKNFSITVLDTSIKMALRLFDMEENFRGAFAAHEVSELAVKRTEEDLRVHQTELEIQNEQLRQAESEMKTHSVRRSELYDLAPIGLFRVSESDTILDANLAAAELLGVDRETPAGQTFSRFICRDDQDAYYFHRKELLDSRQRQSCDLRMQRFDGELFSAHIESAVRKGATADCITAVLSREGMSSASGMSAGTRNGPDERYQ